MFTELGILCIIMYSKFKTSIDSSWPREGNCNPCWSLQSPGTAQYHSEKGVVLVWPSPIWNICQTILLCVLVQLKHDSKSSSIDKILQLFLKQSGKQSFLVISGVSPLERGRFCQANWFCLCRHAWRTLGAVCSTAESICPQWRPVTINIVWQYIAQVRSILVGIICKQALKCHIVVI